MRQKHLKLKWYEQKEGEAISKEALNAPHYTKGGFSTPGYENLHELTKWMTTEYARNSSLRNWQHYYDNSSTITMTEYYPDGSFKVVREHADNNFDSMPDITRLMRDYLPAPKKEEEILAGGFTDPNMPRTDEEAKRNGGKYYQYSFPGMGLVKQSIPGQLPANREEVLFKPDLESLVLPQKP